MSRRIPKFLSRQTAHYMHDLPGCDPFWTTVADLHNIRIFFRWPDNRVESRLFPRLDDDTLTPTEEKPILNQEINNSNDTLFSNE